MHPMDSPLNEFQNLKENYKINCFELCEPILNDLELTKIIINSGIDINILDVKECTKLTYESQAEILKILTYAGADVHTEKIDKKTLIKLVSKLEGFSYEKRLAQTSKIYCMLRYLTENYKSACFELCKTILTLDFSFLEQLQTIFPEILHYSIIKNDTEFTKQLIKSGININIKDDQGCTPLILATLEKARRVYGDNRGVGLTALLLIDAGADVNTSDNEGVTALMNAASSKLSVTKVVKRLLDAGADVNVRDKDANTALMSAATNGKCKIATMLIEAGADVNARDLYGVTALMSAVGNRNIEIAKLLIASGADVNAKDNNGITALSETDDHTKLAKLLIKAGADVNTKDNNGQTALIRALDGWDIKKVMLLISAGADFSDLNYQGNSDLLVAVCQGNIKKIKFAIKSGADINAKDCYGNTALSFAAWKIIHEGKKSFTKIVKLLIEGGADINVAMRASDQWTALMSAAGRGKTELAKLLIDAGAKLDATDQNGNTALLASVMGGREESIKLLIYAGADVNAKDNNGCTALINASRYCNTEIAKLLVDAGADDKIKDKSGKTALDYAIEENRPEMIEFLLLSGDYDKLFLEEAFKKAEIKKQTQNMFQEFYNAVPDINIIRSCLEAGADVNASSYNGTTILMLAMSERQTEIVKLIIAAGADVNARSHGMTAILFAAQNGLTEIAKGLYTVDFYNDYYDEGSWTKVASIETQSQWHPTEIVKLLINSGADVNACDDNGWTALMWALEYDFTEIANLLRANGAC